MPLQVFKGALLLNENDATLKIKKINQHGSVNLALPPKKIRRDSNEKKGILKKM